MKEVIRFFRRFGPISLLYVVIASLTRAYFLHDTMTYTNDILAFDRGYSDIPVNPFWEFGHLFWRPLGWLVYKFLWAVLPSSLGLDERLVCAIGLITINLLCGWLAVVLFYSLALQFTGSRALSYLIALTLMCTNAFLNDMHSGAAYLPGLALLTLGVWFILRRESLTSACAAGAALAGAVLLWLPYIVLIPAALLVGILGTGAPARSRIRFVSMVILACACVGFAGYSIGAFEFHPASFAELEHWAQDASHGMHQNRNLVRTLFGLPRAFVFVSDDGVLYKRYLFHDPYAHITVWDLLRFSLVKVGLFYLAVLALLISLIRGFFARRMLVCLLTAGILQLGFAVLIFEGSGLERYLPLFPFLCLALAAFLTTPRPRVWAVAVTAGFIGLAFVTNLHATFYTTVAADAESMATRVRSLGPVFKPNSRAALISFQDPLSNFGSTFPFHRLNRSIPVTTFPITEVIRNAKGWDREFATQVLAVWARSGDLWVTKRVFAPRPEPEWDWTEGDNPNLSWTQLHGFFQNLQITDDIGGPDGFVLVPPSERNRRFLLSAATPSQSPSVASRNGIGVKQ